MKFQIGNFRLKDEGRSRPPEGGRYKIEGKVKGAGKMHIHCVSVQAGGTKGEGKDLGSEDPSYIVGGGRLDWNG